MTGERYLLLHPRRRADHRIPTAQHRAPGPLTRPMLLVLIVVLFLRCGGLPPTVCGTVPCHGDGAGMHGWRPTSEAQTTAGAHVLHSAHHRVFTYEASCRAGLASLVLMPIAVRTHTPSQPVSTQHTAALQPRPPTTQAGSLADPPPRPGQALLGRGRRIWCSVLEFSTVCECLWNSPRW
eukprot:COSAG02_NODE_816_length_16859_cov_15.645764_4_plen_180_part_00